LQLKNEEKGKEKFSKMKNCAIKNETRSILSLRCAFLRKYNKKQKSKQFQSEKMHIGHISILYARIGLNAA
jgi:hypothetical protein